MPRSEKFHNESVYLVVNIKHVIIFTGVSTSTCLSPQQNVNLLFYPILIEGGVSVSAFLVYKTREILQLINKIKKLADIICDGWCVWVQPFQMLLVYFTNTFHALIDCLIIRVSSRLWLYSRLNKENCVRHVWIINSFRIFLFTDQSFFLFLDLNTVLEGNFQKALQFFEVQSTSVFNQQHSRKYNALCYPLNFKA